MDTYKVVLLGDTGVGKTSILEYLVKKKFVETVPTIGAGYYGYKISDKIRLNIWDTAGQEKYRSLIPMYYRGADICLIVFDINDYKVDNIEEWINTYMSNTTSDYENIILVGNKIDKITKPIMYKDLDNLSRKYKLFETSAIDGKNIFLLFEFIKYKLENGNYHHNYKPEIETITDDNKYCCFF